MWYITKELGNDIQRKDLEKGGGIPQENKYSKLCELYNDKTANDDMEKIYMVT